MHFTQNPIGSADQLDLQDNAISFDYAMNSPAALWQDRFGKQHKTVQQALKDVGFKPAGFDFVTGGTLGIGDRDKCVFYPTDGYWYSWNGKIPYVIPANSSPTPSGKKGWGLVNLDNKLRDEFRIIVPVFRSISELLTTDPKDGLLVTVRSYHDGLEYGGGDFKYEASRTPDVHDGGMFIAHKATFPTDWTNKEQITNFLYSPIVQNGVWVRQNADEHDITNYGVKKDGTVLINDFLNRIADKNISIYLPRGKYKLENFTRTIPVGGNINQTSLILYGDPTFGNTDQTYSWDQVTVIQGAGDMFKQVVNTVVRDVYFRNTPGEPLGKLFSLGAYAQCEIANCVFGPSNYHFYNEGNGFIGYNVKPFFRNCRFYGAKIWSRYFEGTVAGYHEQDCYSSKNKKALYLAAPVSTSISDCIFEYNDDNAITIDAYGYKSAEYQISIKNTFFETNGAGPIGSYRDISLPHVVIKSIRGSDEGQPATDAAIIRLQLENSSFVDVTDKRPAFGAVLIDSKTTIVTSCNNRIEPAISEFKQKIFTASVTFYADPVWHFNDGMTSIIEISDKVRTNTISSDLVPRLNLNPKGARLELGGYGFNTAFNTLAPSSELTLVLTTLPGLTFNGEILLTATGAAGYSTYKYRVTGNSNNKNITLIDSKETGGYILTLNSTDDPVKFTITVRNNGVVANVLIGFVGIVL